MLLTACVVRIRRHEMINWHLHVRKGKYGEGGGGLVSLCCKDSAS